MSKVIPFVTGSAAKSQVVDAAAKVLSAVGVTFKNVSVSEASAALSGNNGVGAAGGLTRADVAALAAATGQQFHSKVIRTEASAALNPDATYADAKYSFVRAFGPSSSNAISSVERLDKFPKSGVSAQADAALCEESFKRTAAEAVKVAKETGASRLTILQKPQTAFAQHNALFLSTIKAALPETISVEVQNTQQVYNSAVMFAKNLGVIVAPDYTAADNFEGITTGIAGGAGLASESIHSDSSTIYAQAQTAGQNPTGLLLAASGALKQMGLSAEAGKIDAALKKVYSSKANLPADVKGGNADAEAFANAVKAAL